jgi:hypothetical protein
MYDLGEARDAKTALSVTCVAQFLAPPPPKGVRSGEERARRVLASPLSCLDLTPASAPSRPELWLADPS